MNRLLKIDELVRDMHVTILKNSRQNRVPDIVPAIVLFTISKNHPTKKVNGTGTIKWQRSASWDNHTVNPSRMF
jgi:hypothetical protein